MEDVTLKVADPLTLSAVIAFSAYVIIKRDIGLVIGMYLAGGLLLHRVVIYGTPFIWSSVAIVCATAALHIIFSKKNKQGEFFSITKSDLFLLLFVAGWATWTLVICLVVFPSAMTTHWSKALILECWMPFGLIILFINTFSELKRIFVGFVVMTALTVCCAIAILPDSLFVMATKTKFQLYGFEKYEYIRLSIAISFSLFMIMFWALSARSRWSKTSAYILMLLAAALLALTGCRQSVIASGVALMVIVFWNLGRTESGKLKKLVIMLGLLTIQVVAYFVTVATSVHDRWSTQLQASKIGRYELYQHAWLKFYESPFFGHGWQYIEIEGGWAHMLVLDVLASQGLVGFALFAAYVSLVAWAAKGSWIGKGDPDLVKYRIICVGFAVYTVVQTLFSGGLVSAHLYWVGAIIWKVGMLAKRRSNVRAASY